MKRIQWLMTALILLMTAPLLAQNMGSSMGHDLDALWRRAQASHDLSRSDAILLLESREITIDDPGNQTTKIHRVVWIGTRAGLRAHADLRVPWNSADSQLDVKVLRTWRENRWWPDADRLSETAIVETLPYAVGHEPDYATMRETMLLHDGVELPCIMETAYSITRSAYAKGGSDAVFVIPQRDPAVRVEYVLRTPGGPAHQRVYNGASEPRLVGDMLVWSQEDVPALKTPTAADPAAYEPCLAWSTFGTWDSVYEKLAAGFNDEGELPDALIERLESRLEETGSTMARLRAITALLGDDVRNVGYDSGWWTAPRSVGRIWDTGYAHRKDRMALAAALFKAAGFQLQFVPHTTALNTDQDLPAASIRDWPLLRIQNGLSGAIYYDPDGDSLAGLPQFAGYSVWTEALEGGPYGIPHILDLTGASTLAVTLDITANPDATWQGHGVYEGQNALSHWASMAGTEAENATALGQALESVCANAEIETQSLEFFSPLEVVAGFTFGFQPGDPDDDGATTLEFGAPDGGLLDALPQDIHLEQSTRQSPIRLAVRLEQSVSVSIDLQGYTVARRPEPIEISNTAGTFVLSVSEIDGTLSLSRKLTLAATEYTAESWPLLRVLLLEEQDPANGRIRLMVE